MNTASTLITLPVELQIAATVLAGLFSESEQQKIDIQKVQLRTAFNRVLAGYSPEQQRQLIENATKQFYAANPRKNVVFVSGIAIPFRNQSAYYFENIADAGWIKVTDIGDENLYFKFKSDCGQELDGYSKCL